MRYMSTRDRWSAKEAYRMGEVQKVTPDAKEALEISIRIANKIADCGSAWHHDFIGVSASGD